MAWTATADVERFDEAVEWFQGRTILSDEDRVNIPAAARSRAFWIAGVAQADVVQDVFDELERSIADGVPFEEFQRNVRDKLTKAWGGDNPHRIETIFRNAAQSSYNAGRWHQMQEESVKRFRPFWMYDAVLDSRTSQICQVRDSTVLDADHSWWDANYPPLHHRCRSGVRSLRRSEAERRGITETPEQEAPPGGWGTSPRVAQEWRPAPGSRDQGLLDELERKRQQRPEPPPPPPRKSLEDLPDAELPRLIQPRPDGFDQDLKTILNRLNDDESAAIDIYSGSEYRAIRDALRLHRDDWAAQHASSPLDYDRARSLGQRVVAGIVRLGGAKNQPRFLYRGISVNREVAEGIVNAEQIVADTVASTSHKPAIGFEFATGYTNPQNNIPVVIRLRTTRTDNTLAAEKISAMEIEQEVLVGPGKRYRVTDAKRVQFRGEDVILVDAEDRNVGELLEFPRRVRLQA